MKTYLLILLSLLVFPFPTKLHGEGIRLLTQNRQIPIEISAKDGIEWLQKEQVYVAKGNAIAKQGTTTINGDTLSAWYTRASDGRAQIFRIDAIGNVRISSPQQNARGTRGVYIVKQRLLILTGSPQLISGSDEIRAQDSLEFWGDKGLAVARGAAKVLRGDSLLQADNLTAYLAEDKDQKAFIKLIEAQNNVLISTGTEIVRAKQGTYDLKTGKVKLRGAAKVLRGDSLLQADNLTAYLAENKDQKAFIKLIEAQNNVLISTGTEIVRAKQGTYDLKTGIVRLAKNVRITRGENQLNGDRGIVNLKTGVSQIFSDSGNKVRGFFKSKKGNPNPKSNPLIKNHSK